MFYEDDLLRMFHEDLLLRMFMRMFF